MKILRDAWNDKSSGILMMLVLFIAAVAIGNVGVVLGADMSKLALLVVAFLVPVAAGQYGQALQGKPPEPSTKSESLGLLYNVTGQVDVGRALKLIAVLVALEVAVLVMILRKDMDLVDVAKLSGVYLAYAAASEITQKAARI